MDTATETPYENCGCVDIHMKTMGVWTFIWKPWACGHSHENHGRVDNLKALDVSLEVAYGES